MLCLKRNFSHHFCNHLNKNNNKIVFIVYIHYNINYISYTYLFFVFIIKILNIIILSEPFYLINYLYVNVYLKCSSELFIRQISTTINLHKGGTYYIPMRYLNQYLLSLKNVFHKLCRYYIIYSHLTTK